MEPDARTWVDVLMADKPCPGSVAGHSDADVPSMPFSNTIMSPNAFPPNTVVPVSDSYTTKAVIQLP
jgi:hypothetical protein